VGLFDKLPVSLIMRAFVINLYPAVFFTKLFMEHNANRQNRSLVINMSSGSALDAVPYFFLYGAAKVMLHRKFDRNICSPWERA
jgi:short-subunit dehydrogenase